MGRLAGVTAMLAWVFAAFAFLAAAIAIALQLGWQPPSHLQQTPEVIEWALRHLRTTP